MTACVTQQGSSTSAISKKACMLTFSRSAVLLAHGKKRPSQASRSSLRFVSIRTGSVAVQKAMAVPCGEACSNGSLSLCAALNFDMHLENHLALRRKGSGGWEVPAFHCLLLTWFQGPRFGMCIHASRNNCHQDQRCSGNCSSCNHMHRSTGQWPVFQEASMVVPQAALYMARAMVSCSTAAVRL